MMNILIIIFFTKVNFSIEEAKGIGWFYGLLKKKFG